MSSSRCESGNLWSLLYALRLSCKAGVRLSYGSAAGCNARTMSRLTRLRGVDPRTEVV